MNPPGHTKDDWKAWDKEKANFAARDTWGFAEDMNALRAHISKLIEVCPKDSAGWPVGAALNVINKLRNNLDTFNRYFDQLR